MTMQTRTLFALFATAALAATAVAGAAGGDGGNTSPDTATARRSKLERMREMLELELAEIEAEEAAESGLAELEAILDGTGSAAAAAAASTDTAATTAAAAKADPVVDTDAAAFAEDSLRRTFHADMHSRYDANGTSQDDASSARQAAENNTNAPHPKDASATPTGNRCTPSSRMARIVSYQQGIAGVEWLDDMTFEPETAAAEAEMDVAALAFTTAPAPAAAMATSSTDNTSADNSMPYTISEPVLVDPPTATAPSPIIEVAPAPAAAAIDDDTTSTSGPSRVTSSRAKAALLKAKASKRASTAAKPTPRPADANTALAGSGDESGWNVGASDQVYSATATAPAPTIREIRKKRGMNQQAVHEIRTSEATEREDQSGTSVSAGYVRPNASTEDMAPNVAPDVTIAIKPAPLIDPAAAAGWNRHTSSRKTRNADRSAVRPSDFMSGFVGTLAVVFMVVAGGAGLAYYVMNARQEEASAWQRSRRVSMAPALTGAYTGEDFATSSSSSLQFGQLRQRGARNAWDDQALPI